MIRGHYTAATGMALQRKLMETITNNITNADTTGYKKDYLITHSFDSVMASRINDSGTGARSSVVGPINMGVQVDQAYTDYGTGNLENTGRNTDMALAGDVFFAVLTQEGERYTKSGSLYVNNDDYLTDGSGNYLLGENGPIIIATDGFTVDEMGNISIEGEFLDRIRILSFEDNANLRKQGGNLFMATAEPEAQTKQFKVLQGYLENSNVDVGREMVDMITVFRTYETNQKILTMIDETLGKAVNEIGRLR